MNHKITDWMAASAFVLVLGISSMWGAYERADVAGDKKDVIQAEELSAERALEGQHKGPDLSEEESAVLKEIAAALETRNLNDAAGIMDREEDLLVGLFYETLDSRRYLYDGEILKEELEGDGLVLTGAGAVFYGSFKDGSPHGRCLALQVVDMDGLRYDYSDGLWEKGMMEGAGHTGYCYVDGSPEGEARDVCRKGNFSGNLMEGEIAYITTNEKSEDITWEFNVKDGIVELDERWGYMENKGEYQLISSEKDSHAYVLGQDQIRQPMWMNLLAWEE